MPFTVRKHVIVRGLVQGVWFRQSTKDMALASGVSGWVANMPDGSVEAVFEGSPAAVESAVSWCAHGPEHAMVEHVEISDQEPQGLMGFDIRH